MLFCFAHISISLLTIRNLINKDLKLYFTSRIIVSLYVNIFEIYLTTTRSTGDSLSRLFSCIVLILLWQLCMTTNPVKCIFIQLHAPTYATMYFTVDDNSLKYTLGCVGINDIYRSSRNYSLTMICWDTWEQVALILCKIIFALWRMYLSFL